MTETPKQIDDGGPAFPSSIRIEDEKGYYVRMDERDGMSTRMWLAGRAHIPWDVLVEALTRKFPEREQNFTFNEILEYRAELRFTDADAMIAASREDKSDD